MMLTNAALVPPVGILIFFGALGSAVVDLMASPTPSPSTDFNQSPEYKKAARAFLAGSIFRDGESPPDTSAQLERDVRFANQLITAIRVRQLPNGGNLPGQACFAVDRAFRIPGDRYEIDLSYDRHTTRRMSRPREQDCNSATPLAPRARNWCNGILEARTG